jgi:hypothetical protein
MPPRTTARPSQVDLFRALRQVRELCLAIKNDGPSGDGNLASVNIHGRFDLFPKHWRGFETPNEDLVFCSSSSFVTTSGEPTVHVHVDWNKARHVVVQNRELPLIGTDTEIAILETVEPEVRVLWFYGRRADLGAFFERFPLGRTTELA